MLSHHVYNTLQNTWMRQKSEPQPCVDINIQAIPSDSQAIGVNPTFKFPSPLVTFNALADTGCQSCLGGPNLLQSLNLQRHNLIPVSMKMTAANNKGIEVIGALPLRLSGTSAAGKTVSTRQLVYFTPATNRMFLSQQACRSLGLVSENFPSIGETLQVNTIKQPESAITKMCQCPKRTMPPPPPQTLPYPATQQNRGKLEAFLLDYYKSSTFNVCDHQTLPMMTGPPLRIMIDPNATPFAVHKPIPIPIHWQEDIYEGLKQDERLGVIEAVPVGTPVTWCHRMVVVPKKSGKPRRTVDLQPLNKYAVRETHHTESPFHQARTVPPHTVKTVMDAWNGYHSIPLHEDDRHMTTFITTKGRYRYRVAPQGYLASGDGYTCRFDEIIMDFPQKTKCVDDTLLWTNSIEEAFFNTVKFLDLCGRNGIVLNPTKFVFAQPTVDFAGFQITPTSVKPSLRSLEAIKDFPTPKNITDVRSWFGLINQVSYAFASADRMLPFRNLLKPGIPFIWNNHLDDLFTESKSIIVQEISDGVEIYDKSKPTCLATDWCKDGLGFWLLQKHCTCKDITPLCGKSHWKVTLVGSRFTTGAESRYAPIEGEALAVVDSLRKSRHFVLGCSDLIVAVDHKPLLKVFSDRSLEDINNPRLLNLKEKTLQFRFRMMHIPGVRHAAADAVSRHPISKAEEVPLPDDMATILSTASPHNFLLSIRSHDNESEICSNTSQSSTVIGAISWNDVRLATTSDPQMCQLIEYIEDGFPDRRETLHPEIRPYYQYRDNLKIYDGIIFYRDRIVMPPSLQEKVLISLHSAHQGISQMISCAEGAVFWPGITPAITDIRAQCTACNRIAPSQPSAPPTAPIMPLYPFQCIAADFFQYAGHHYLVAVDRYSNWPIVESSVSGAEGLISALRKIFITFGISEELTSDGGSEFTSHATSTFLTNWAVNHRVSSAYFPHSNSRAEIAVKTIKRLLMDNTGSRGSLDTDKFQRAMLQYRNTPDRDTGLSPAMCVFGRSIRDFIPVHPGKYLPHPVWRETLAAREMALRNRHQKTCERLTEHTRCLPPLKVGDCVRVQNQTGPHPTKWDKTGVIIEVRQFNQYIIRMDGSGRVTLRNRQFLRKYIPVVERGPISNRPGPVIPTNPTPKPPITDLNPSNPTTKPPTTNPHQSPTTSTNSKSPPAATSPNSQPASTSPNTPARIIKRVYRRSLLDGTRSPTAQQTLSKTPAAISEPLTHTTERHIITSDTASSPVPPVTTPPENSENSTPTPATPAAAAKPKRLPLYLKQLQSYNAPGLSEQVSQPRTEHRVTRQSSKQ